MTEYRKDYKSKDFYAYVYYATPFMNDRHTVISIYYDYKKFEMADKGRITVGEKYIFAKNLDLLKIELDAMKVYPELFKEFVIKHAKKMFAMANFV